MDLSSPEHRTILSRSNAATGAALGARLLAVAIILVAAWLYLPPYKEAFVGDDYLHLGYIAPFLDSPLEALRVLHPTWTTWYYRPLQNLWFLANRLLFGLTPSGYYALQALAHSAVVAAVYALGRKVGLARPAALLATALAAISAQHHDVVAWLSSIAIILVALFGLLATATYLTYLRRPHQPWRLLPVLACIVMTLFSHEEGILLIPFFLALRLILFRQRRLQRAEALVATLTALLTLALIATQFLRPNLTISFREQPVSAFVGYLHPLELAHYLVTVGGRWLFLDKSLFGVRLLASIAQNPLLELVLAAAILLLAIHWFRHGGKVIRMGLLWAALHLGFLYLAVWTQVPEFFAGRHLYNTWIVMAIVLAVKATHSFPVLQAYTTSRKGSGLRLTASALFLFLAASSLFVGDDQRAWKQRTEQVAAAEAQMKALLPAATPSTDIYAHRFALQPSFTPYAAAVWYREPGIGGGSLQRLQQQPSLSSETYLFDYEDGRLYNLWPDLQRHDRTIPLWQPQELLLRGVQSAGARGAFLPEQVAGPTADRRLAVELQLPEEGWLALLYETTVPENSRFIVDLLGAPQTTFRLQVLSQSGQPIVERLVSIEEATSGAWQQLQLPTSAKWGRSVTIRLEVTSPQQRAYLTIPRFVIGAEG